MQLRLIHQPSCNPVDVDVFGSSTAKVLLSELDTGSLVVDRFRTALGPERISDSLGPWGAGEEGTEAMMTRRGPG